MGDTGMMYIGTPDLLLKINKTLLVRIGRNDDMEIVDSDKIPAIYSEHGTVFISASTTPGTLIRIRGESIRLLRKYFEMSPVEVVMFEKDKFPNISSVKLHKTNVYLIRNIECEDGKPAYVEYLYIPRRINEAEKEFLCKYVIDCDKAEFFDSTAPIIQYTRIFNMLEGIHDDWKKALTINING
jgi:hypothetical protein